MLRRDWVAKLNLAIDCPPSTKFISRLTGVPAATYRQRYHRTGESPVDMFDNFDAEFELKTGAKVMALANLVSKTETSLPWELREEEDEVLIGSTIYVGLRLLSETQESARLASCLSESITTHLENGLSRLNRRRPTALLARGDINRDTFVDAVLETGLPIAMNAASPPSAVTSRVCTAMDFAGDPWNFASPEDVIDLSPWISVWKANEVDIEVSIRPTGRSALDEHVLDRLRDVEVRRPRVIPARHFKRGARATLKCMPTRDGKNGRKARASPQICFLVTSCAIAAVVLSTLGDQE